jgi:hypothetical protein
VDSRAKEAAIGVGVGGGLVDLHPGSQFVLDVKERSQQ